MRLKARSGRPHKNEVIFFEPKSNVFEKEKKTIGTIFLLKSSFFLMFAGAVIGPSRGPRV